MSQNEDCILLEEAGTEGMDSMEYSESVHDDDEDSSVQQDSLALTEEEEEEVVEELDSDCDQT